MPFSVKYGNILDYRADALVIPANPKPVIGKGLDKVIYHEAGRNRLLAARKKLGEISFGQVGITDAYSLRERDFHFLVHAVSPAYDGSQGESEALLKECYSNALKAAWDHNCKSIVFPLLSTGVLKYPKDRARFLAEEVCRIFCEDHDMDVTLVIYSPSDKASEEEIEELCQYVDENSYCDYDPEMFKSLEKAYGKSPEYDEGRMLLELMRKQLARKNADERAYKAFQEREEQKRKQKEVEQHGTVDHTSDGSMEQYMSQRRRASFNDTLNLFMKNKKIGTIADLCKKANLRKDTLSKLQGGRILHPERDYLWAIAIALQLNLDETEILFNSCGISRNGAIGFKSSDERRERAVEYAIIHKWGIDKLNNVLFDSDMCTLGNYS